MPKKKKYDDFANVEIDRNYQIPEEFPEGTYGEPVNAEQPLQSQVDNPNRRPYSAFNYENKTLHADVNGICQTPTHLMIFQPKILRTSKENCTR